MHTAVGEKVAGPSNAPVIGECVPLCDEPFGIDQITKSVKCTETLDGLLYAVAA